MSRWKAWLLPSGVMVVLLGDVALAQESTTFSYDALGRLTGNAISGGPNNTRTTTTCFDAAGNRKRHDVATSTANPCPIPSPTP